MTYRYLVTYATGADNGAIDINRPVPIRNRDDVNGITDYLRDHKGEPSLLVTGFSRYEEDQ